MLVTRIPNDRNVFPVSIREIGTVEPMLKDVSFVTYLRGNPLSIGTRIVMKKGEQTALWCTVPCPENLSPRTWAKEVYEEGFGDGSWDTEASAIIAERQARAAPPPEKVTAESKLLANLREKLDDLQCEDWDNSDDEDDGEKLSV